MPTGRTSLTHARVYVDGYDLSGYAREIGPLSTEFEARAEAALGDTVKRVMGGPGRASLNVGKLNGWLDNSAGGLHALTHAPGAPHVVTVALGIQAPPAPGDPAFCGQWLQRGYRANPGGRAVPVTLDFGEWAANAAVQSYERAWGALLNAGASSVTGPNEGTASHDNGAATNAGGFAVLHALSGDGTATVSVQHADTDDDAAFDAAGDVITFASLDFSTPTGALAAASPAAEVKRFTRWQIAFDGGTTARFVLALVRGL